MPRYKVTFAPHDVLSYTYEVEVDDPNNAHFVAMDDFRFDIGYDRSKDFDVVGVEEIEEYEE
tara:strand:- start:44 stop:229 length:186 start_codon:yes stop_codon:yes gene_type:complete